MNTLAIISDIHGNKRALETVLADIQRRGVSEIICLGDVVANGPKPHETLNIIREKSIPVIMGNTDDMLLHLPKEKLTQKSDRSNRIADVDYWTLEQLTASDKDFIRQFMPVIQFDLGGVDVLCYHGSPSSYDNMILIDTQADQVKTWIGDYKASVLVGGHTHVQMFRRLFNMIVVNPGSVGLCFEYTTLGNHISLPISEYAILENINSGFSVNLCRIPIDLDEIIDDIVSSNMPHAKYWVKEWEGGRDE